MGTFARLNRLLKSNLRSVVDGSDDPTTLIERTLDEMADGIKEAKRDLVTAQGSAKRLRSEAGELSAEAQRWEDRAALALRVGDEALARDALREKLRLSRSSEERLGQAHTAQRAADELEVAIEQLQKRRADLELRKGSLAAQVRTARQPADAPGANVGEGLGRLRSLSDRIDALEAEVEVAGVLDDPERRRVEARFAELEKSAASDVVEDDLAALKRQVEQD